MLAGKLCLPPYLASGHLRPGKHPRGAIDRQQPLCV